MRLCYLNYSASWGGLEMYSADLFEALLADVAQFNDPMARYAYCFCRID